MEGTAFEACKLTREDTDMIKTLLTTAAVLSLVDSVRTLMLKGTFSAADTSITP